MSDEATFRSMNGDPDWDSVLESRAEMERDARGAAMPDYPAKAIAAAVRALQVNPWVAEWECGDITEEGIARLVLDASAPALAESYKQHLDTDHAVMVKLGRIADTAVRMLEHINMDTDEDRELHARAVGALRGRLDEMAATMKEANEAPREEGT